ncbi:Malonyl CoA-acyl carrier protein transacylase [Smittium culicis]|uniref:[acyl-carrier-protein] S-malonyltransferase n=1 Tax=Smittium culicis TaxID=133412 RepID=A0A1R1XKA9_9FUNG|nr:Malonyl CoA-acyl carrier protein transacylase [Smittium culicis]
MFTSSASKIARLTRFYSTSSILPNKHVAQRALTFPGQGSQFIGMGRDLYDNFTAAKQVFEQVDETLGYKFSDTIFSGDYVPLAFSHNLSLSLFFFVKIQFKSLTDTENAQPAIVTVGVAAIAALEQISGCKIKDLVSYTLGHSVGEYTALIVSNSLSLSDGIKLVKLRGKAMKESINGIDSTMIAIITRNNSIKEIVASANSTNEQIQNSIKNNDKKFNKNDLSTQVTLSGTKSAVNLAIQNLNDTNLSFRTAVLPVGAPFHCDLLLPASSQLKHALEETTFAEMQIPIIANYTGIPIKSHTDIKSLLVSQTCSTVKWLDSLSYLHNTAGITRWLCAGPSPVIAGMIKKEIPKSITRLLTNSKDIYNCLHVLESQKLE